MVDVGIALGASYDLASPKDVNDGFTAVRDAVDKSHRLLVKTLRAQAPISRSLTASGFIGDRNQINGTTIATPNTVLNLGHPSVGRTWSLVNFCLVGADDHTVLAAASAAIYIGDPSAPAQSQVVIPGLIIPSQSDYSNATLSEGSGYDFFAVVYGTANSPVTLNARFQEFPIDASTPTFV